MYDPGERASMVTAPSERRDERKCRNHSERVKQVMLIPVIFSGSGWWWWGGIQSGIMPVVSSQEELEKLTRRHAVKVLPQAGCSVEEVGYAVGEVVGFESVKSASRTRFTPVYPVNPSKKITVSNAPPFIKNDDLSKALSRRQLYMILKDTDSHLNLTLNFKVDGFNYIVFVTSETMKCFGCGAEGHLIRACPEARRENAGSSGSGGQVEGRPWLLGRLVEDAARLLGLGRAGGGRLVPRALGRAGGGGRRLLGREAASGDSSNERDWRREWPGQVFLSHKQSNNAGVGILFSRAFSPQSVELHHVLPGHALMVKALFFFSLERRNGQRKVIHCLRSDNGSLLTETTEIRRYATGFYRDLFKTGISGGSRAGFNFSCLAYLKLGTHLVLCCQLT
ncbi:hypothetical protein L3Q82_000368 [Scortum barcoo]|uniref:Uncharacterized protein n=1 Tax=Scortum barcoo TaxID=214431 RepID=A0ACB8X9Q2_9TELE|nr:hypothetical protein L3Q82_000368 [Scortum barcoo]